MQEVHIGSKGTEVVIPAGHLNRAMRRKLAKMNGKFKKQNRGTK